MLDTFGQPEDYSQMLKRIFVFTAGTGLICTLVLASFSPPIRAILFSSDTNLSLGFVDLPWLAVVIPFALAIISRAIKLHDKVSDLFGIRRRFDLGQILVPLAERVGISMDETTKTAISAKRHQLMRNVFYVYAPNAKDAVINRQYVADALDKWGWFWCCVEPSVIVLLGAIVAGLLVNRWLALVFIVTAICLDLAAFGLWFGCKRAAQRQVDDILDDNTRRDAVRERFHAVLHPGT